jgi:type IV pilus assembly protein PilO
MNMSILTQILQLRMRAVLALAVLLAVVLGLQLFISLYQNPQVEKLNTEWLKLREQEERGVALQDRDTLYRNGLADLAKFREAIYPKSQFARFIGELYEMTSKNCLELASISYKPTLDKEKNLLRYSLTLSVSGTYNQLKRFIYDLGAGNSNLLLIDSIAIAAAGASTESVQLQLSITSWFTMEAP